MNADDETKRSNNDNTEDMRRAGSFLLGWFITRRAALNEVMQNYRILHHKRIEQTSSPEIPSLRFMQPIWSGAKQPGLYQGFTKFIEYKLNFFCDYISIIHEYTHSMSINFQSNKCSLRAGVEPTPSAARRVTGDRTGQSAL
ncbi:hypothetical protein EVAR_47306_1 [Eumeta japonica]|uniref:Uncharacterized protein n=1 Tax=Eumeta variegata TaxID=151549 RepID=A0A4C1YJN7_EUMVA|nr:hypothetical protein EVAR_47306_1 [Eumeta japonica]